MYFPIAAAGDGDHCFSQSASIETKAENTLIATL